MKAFSKDWTAEERLKLVIILTDMIRDDVQKCANPAKCGYGRIGRPNVQSVHEMIVATRAALESYRADIEKLCDEHFSRPATARDEFFDLDLADLWTGKVVP